MFHSSRHGRHGRRISFLFFSSPLSLSPSISLCLSVWMNEWCLIRSFSFAIWIQVKCRYVVSFFFLLFFDKSHQKLSSFSHLSSHHVFERSIPRHGFVALVGPLSSTLSFQFENFFFSLDIHSSIHPLAQLSSFAVTTWFSFNLGRRPHTISNQIEQIAYRTSSQFW